MSLSLVNCIYQISQFNFQTECIGLVASKFIGIFIIAFSCTLKVPQIKNMLKDKDSCKQLSEFSVFADIFAYLAIALYNIHYSYPFTSYGENLIILIQNAFILYLFIANSKLNATRLVIIIATIVFSAVCLHGEYIPEYLWFYIGNSALPFVVINRLSTIAYCFNNKSSGPLSSFTFILAAGGCLTRIFTTFNETKDMMLIVQSGIAMVLNVIVLVQILMYGNSKDDSKKKTQ